MFTSTVQLTDEQIALGEVRDTDNRRVLVARDLSEWLVLAHFRRWCHDMTACPACQAGRR